MKYDALKELQSVMEKYNIRFTVLDDYSLDIDWEDEKGRMHETNVYSGDLRCGWLTWFVRYLEDGEVVND